MDATARYLNSPPDSMIHGQLAENIEQDFAKDVVPPFWIFFLASKQTSLFLAQLQPQQNKLKLKTQNAQNREKSIKFSHQIINPVAEAC